ncbi:hypothetical protein [Priestia koreensis]|uniref:hypothetical protein n=1 Tax=Priestia koreensis TaxID=284581 RepID=UPI0020416774|nr:hypothetical protein [Priestia koreensis]MCM3006097.1 hypothetical protein [Priestia koreensis]
MNEKGIFHLQSTVTVTNISEDSWTALVFYFVPNMFTQKSPPQLNQPSDIHFNKVAINGESANFKLQKDTLTVPLKKELAENKEIKVMFDYHFTLPENGLRFTKSQQNYYLGQFYPMVATYRNHEWNKEPYRFRGETYHTAFSDFKVAYDLPKEYTMVSTSENDTFPSKNKGIFEVKQVKEVFIALLKKPFIFEQKEENVTIRVIGLEQNDQLYKKIRKEAASAFTFFSKNDRPISV